MNSYSIALFLHIIGALGFSAALGLEWTGLQQIRSARLPAQVAAWMPVLGGTRRLGFISMLTAVLTGVFMMATAWGGTPWLFVSVGALILLILLSGLAAPRMAAVGRALAREGGPLSDGFRSIVGHPLLSISVRTRAAITLGIVFLKIAKPDWTGSLLVIGLAIALGLASAFPVASRVRAQRASAD